MSNILKSTSDLLFGGNTSPIMTTLKSKPRVQPTREISESVSSCLSTKRSVHHHNITCLRTLSGWSGGEIRH
jgi:hypothetical protein